MTIRGLMRDRQRRLEVDEYQAWLDEQADTRAMRGLVAWCIVAVLAGVFLGWFL